MYNIIFWLPCTRQCTYTKSIVSNSVTTELAPLIILLSVPHHSISVLSTSMCLLLFGFFIYIRIISHMSEIIRYLSFSICLILLSIIPTSFTHIVAFGRFHLFKGWIVFHCVCVCVYHMFFICFLNIFKMVVWKSLSRKFIIWSFSETVSIGYIFLFV